MKPSLKESCDETDKIMRVVISQAVQIRNYKYLLEKDHTPSTDNSTPLIRRQESLKIARRDLLEDFQGDDVIVKKIPINKEHIFSKRTAS